MYRFYSTEKRQEKGVAYIQITSGISSGMPVPPFATSGYATLDVQATRVVKTMPWTRLIYIHSQLYRSRFLQFEVQAGCCSSWSNEYALLGVWQLLVTCFVIIVYKYTFRPASKWEYAGTYKYPTYFPWRCAIKR